MEKCAKCMLHKDVGRCSRKICESIIITYATYLIRGMG